LGLLAMLVIGSAEIAFSQPRPGGDPANAADAAQTIVAHDGTRLVADAMG
jgi:hypothetical protein